MCVSGASSRASLEGTRLFDGCGMGLLVCGRAEASAAECSFLGMGAAGEKGNTPVVVLVARKFLGKSRSLNLHTAITVLLLCIRVFCCMRKRLSDRGYIFLCPWNLCNGLGCDKYYDSMILLYLLFDRFLKATLPSV